jgi:hypothetical protein
MGNLWQPARYNKGARDEFRCGVPDAGFGCGYYNDERGTGYRVDYPFTNQCKEQLLFGYVPVVSVETLLNNMVITNEVNK